MKTILLPTDFSHASDKAVEFGIEIAKRSGARIVLVNAFYIPLIDLNVPQNFLLSMYEAEEKESKNHLKKMADHISSHKDSTGKSLQCDYITEQSIPESEIVKITEKEKPDLVIMGTGNKEHFWGLFGSTTASAVNNLKCPILIVKEDTIFQGIYNIDFALDAVKEDIYAVKSLSRLAEIFSAKITIVHIEKHAQKTEDIRRIYESTEEAESFVFAIREYCSYDNIYYQTVLNDDTAHGLLEYLNQTNSDALAVLKVERNWLEGIFHKSVIKNLIIESKKPLFIIHK